MAEAIERDSFFGLIEQDARLPSSLAQSQVPAWLSALSPPVLAPACFFYAVSSVFRRGRITRMKSILFAAISATAALVSASGCNLIARGMATQDPGLSPRNGQVFRVDPVGSEQVRVTFTFKIGRDPVVPQTPATSPDSPPLSPRTAAAPRTADSAVRVVDARFTDRAGRPIETIDSDVRQIDNVYYVSFTSGAVNPESYEVICQALLSAGSFQLRLATAVTHELNAWRAEPASFRFAVYGAAERTPLFEFNILQRR
jgi:hypothetical protein